MLLSCLTMPARKARAAESGYLNQLVTMGLLRKEAPGCAHRFFGRVESLRHRKELFQVRQVRRIYDRANNKFSFNISYETAVQPTPRAIVVAEAFGLGIDDAQRFTVLDAEFKITLQDIVLITGTADLARAFYYEHYGRTLAAKPYVHSRAWENRVSVCIHGS